MATALDRVSGELCFLDRVSGELDFIPSVLQ